jgi:molybdate transport system substrate-binding protein
MIRVRRSARLAFAALLVAASSARAQRESAPITVFAAADLAAPFHEIAARFEAERHVPVRLVLGASGTLAIQIEHGAPADVYFAANVAFVDGLRAKGIVVPETERVYARGRLVVATSVKTGIALGSIRDLARAEVRRVAIANPETAPYGAAAVEALDRSGLRAVVQPKLVQGENIRQTLQLVESGAVDAGILSATAALEPGIRSAPIDPALHAPIDQAAAVVAASHRRADARAFLDFVLGEEGRAVMARYGFAFPDSP